MRYDTPRRPSTPRPFSAWQNARCITDKYSSLKRGDVVTVRACRPGKSSPEDWVIEVWHDHFGRCSYYAENFELAPGYAKTTHKPGRREPEMSTGTYIVTPIRADNAPISTDNTVLHTILNAAVDKNAENAATFMVQSGAERVGIFKLVKIVEPVPNIKITEV